MALSLILPLAEAQITGSSRLLPNRDGQSAAWNGVGRLRIGGGCTATFLKPVAGDLPESTPAYLLTAGHCIRLTSSPNEVIVDSPAPNGTFIPGYFVDTQDRQETFRTRRVAYASMKGTDVAIVELDATFGQLAGKGYRPLELSSEQPSAGEPIAITGIPSNDIPPDERFLRRVSCVQRAAATLVELIWTFYDFYPNDCADIRGGSSGSPVVSERTGGIVGVLNTSTQAAPYFGSGFDCYLNLPCEIRADGPVVARETNYTAPTLGLEKCFRPDGVFDLGLAACPLDKGRPLTLSGTLPRTTRPAVEQADGQARRITWNTTVAGFRYYRYKIGQEGITECRSPDGYGPVIELAASSKIDEPVPETPGGYYLCVVGGASPIPDGTWQEPRLAVFRHVRIDTTPPILSPPIELTEEGENYRLSFGFIPPEISNVEYKLGPPGETDCAASSGYQSYRRVPINISKSLEPLKLCVVGQDEAGNRTPPIQRALDGLQIFPEGLVNAVSFVPGPVAPGSFASLFGLNFTERPGEAAGVAVGIIDSGGIRREARVYFVSRGQVNLLVPAATALGAATIVVTREDGRSARLPIQVDRVSPGLFTASGPGSGVSLANVVRVQADGSRLSQPAFQCAQAFACATVPIDLSPDSGQAFVELYGTGLRGAGSGGVRVWINEVPVEVLYAGPQPGADGLDQVNVYLPDSLIPRGYVTVTLTAGGKTANPVRLQLR